MADFIRDNSQTVIMISVAVVIIVIVAIILVIKSLKGAQNTETNAIQPINNTRDDGNNADNSVQESVAEVTEKVDEGEKTEAVQVAEEEPAETPTIATEEKTEEIEPGEEKPEKTETKIVSKAKQNKATENFEKKSEVKMAEVVKENGQEFVQDKASSRYVGKWFIVQKAEEEFIAVLRASNGQVLLTSESYATEKSVRAGIATITRNVAADNFQIYTDKKDNFFYKLKDAGNRLLCVGEVYNNKKSCASSIESVKKFAEKAVIQDGVTKDMTLHYYTPTETVTEDESNIKDQYRGKWIISKDEDGMYIATLYASNGQILLNSEKYKLLDSAYKAIENYKKNSEANNFIIDIDKTGRYYYKLRNQQKLTLAVGETYNTEKRCIEALESFKRFNRIAKLMPYEENPADTSKK